MHPYRYFSRFILLISLLLLTVSSSSFRKQLSLDTLATDAIGMPESDLAGPGRQRVDSTRVKVLNQGESLEVVLYKPAHPQASAPAIVFLPGRMATDDQYESYARALASRGFVVAVRTWYSLFRSDIELAHDAKVIADWLIQVQGVDSRKIGIAGHSMGGKNAVMAAAKYCGSATR